MACNVALIFVFIVVCVSLQNSVTAFVHLRFKTNVVGQLGQPSLLQCVIETSQEGKGAYMKGLSWNKDEDSIIYWRNGTKNDPPMPGFELAEPHLDRMNVSLLITNTTIANAGNYKCSVTTNKGENDCSINFTVTAKYSVPSIRFIPEKRTLVCESHGGYPKGEIQWMANHDAELLRGAEMVAKPDQSGLFILSSKLTVQPESNQHYTCVVLNATGGKEAETTYPAGDGSKLEIKGNKVLDNQTKIVAPVVVIGSLTVGLLIVVVVLLRRRAQRKARRQSTAPIMGDSRNTGHDVPDEEEGEGLTDPDPGHQV